jgi:hypothetical protein
VVVVVIVAVVIVVVKAIRSNYWNAVYLK